MKMQSYYHNITNFLACATKLKNEFCVHSTVFNDDYQISTNEILMLISNPIILINILENHEN